MQIYRLKHDVRAADLSQLTVFISYKTEQWRFASWLAHQLRAIGFDVLIVPPPSPSDRIKTQSQIEDMLRGFANEADCFCLVGSQPALDSDWVQIEYKEAVEAIGRLTFVCDNTIMPAGDMMTQRNPFGLSTRTYIKSNTLHFPSLITFHVNALAADLLNDPERGAWRDRSKLNPYFSQRNFKKDSMTRKYARLRTLADRRFRGQFVFDVIPFTWKELSCRTGDTKQALQKLLAFDGLLAAEIRRNEGIAAAYHVTYRTSGDHQFAHELDDPIEAFAFVGLEGWQEKLQQKQNERQNVHRNTVTALDDYLNEIRKNRE